MVVQYGAPTEARRVAVHVRGLYGAPDWGRGLLGGDGCPPLQVPLQLLGHLHGLRPRLAGVDHVVQLP